MSINSPDGTVDEKTRQMAMFLHLSQLIGYVTGGLGLIIPIVIWQMKKSEMPWLDEHGKNVTNWIITFIIYAAIGVVTIPIGVGAVILAVLGVLEVVYPIVGGIKANNGEVWKYPGTITFIN